MSAQVYDQAADELEQHGKVWHAEVCSNCGYLNPIGQAADRGPEMIGMLALLLPALAIAFLLGAVLRPLIDTAVAPLVRVVFGS